MQSRQQLRVGIVSLEWTTITGSGSAAIELSDALRSLGFHVVDFAWAGPGRSSSLPARTILSRVGRLIDLAASLRRERISVVVVNTTVQSTAVLAAKLAGCRVIWWCHESGLAMGSTVARLRRKVYQALSHSVVAVSESSGLATGCAHIVIPNQISPSPTPPVIPEGPHFTVLFLGKTSLMKGVDRLPEIMARIAYRYEDVRLIVAGPGPSDAELDAVERAKRKLERLLGSRLTWIGAQLDVEPLFAAAHLLVLPSRSDSRPRVVEEALARGVPVLASELLGVREIHARARAEVAIQYLSGDEQLVSLVDRAIELRVAARGQSLIETFDPDEIFSTWVREIFANV